MDQFLTLREFLELKDPLYNYPREYHTVSMDASGWVKFYDAAKASWEKYGNNPPVGANVRTKVWDSGRRWGFDGVFIGVFNRDNRFFAIEREDRSVVNGKCISIHFIPFWWAEFSIVEER